ncbi:hypothetical protein QJS10_CPB12g00436 [Acorus calamus]|uniref:Uncharacterized protein n=1 Tax=Acorus calamus TaxID=4465 RepID=A0AAV9DQC8_ACOCL|nr:hypothetical protein QJS10_CPB12g00436 [Acorus calamus]
METASEASKRRWGHFRIIAGAFLGGALGFYVMHKAENRYKEKMRERLAEYEKELDMKKKKTEVEFSEP